MGPTAEGARRAAVILFEGGNLCKIPSNLHATCINPANQRTVIFVLPQGIPTKKSCLYSLVGTGIQPQTKLSQVFRVLKIFLYPLVTELPSGSSWALPATLLVPAPSAGPQLLPSAASKVGLLGSEGSPASIIAPLQLSCLFSDGGHKWYQLPNQEVIKK